MGREFDAVIVADKVLQQFRRESRQIKLWIWIKRDRGIEVKKARRFCAKVTERVRVLQFAEGVPGHGKSGHAVQAIFGMPEVGRKAGKLKLEGQSLALASWSSQAADIGVDAIGECRKDCLRVGRVTFIFRSHITAIAQSAGVYIARQGGWSENFRKPSLPSAFPNFHLEETILSSDDALSKEKIVLVLGVNVRDSPTIAENVDRLRQPWNMQLAGDDGQSLMCRVIGIQLLLGLRTNAERKKNNQEANVFHGQAIAMLNGARGEVPVYRAGAPRLHWQSYFCVGAWFCGTAGGAAGAGVVDGDCDFVCAGFTPENTEVGPVRRAAKIESVIDVSMKIMADHVVARERTEAAPRGPNAVWLPWPPKAAAKSPLLPLCSNTTAIRNRQTIT